jgi:hypothetical protein
MPKRKPYPFHFTIEWGLLTSHDHRYGKFAHCCVCAAPHRMLGFIRVEESRSLTDFMLCNPCHVAQDSNAVARYLNKPDLTMEHGSERF